MQQHLRVAMISLHSCPLGNLGGKDTGGMNVYVREYAEELGRRGYNVDIYTKVHNSEHKRLVSLGNNVRLIHLETGDDESIPKIALYSYVQRFACSLESFRKSEELQYDLVHSHYWLSGLVGQQLSSWWNIPHITMFHTLGAVKNQLGIGEDEPELRIQGERDVMANCTRIIAATERERNELVQYYGASPEMVAVIPCGVNLELFKPVDRQTARKKVGMDSADVILFVGRLEPLKGLDQILKALALLQKGKTPRLVIVGGDESSQDYTNMMKSMVRKLGIEDHVIFVGSVTQDRLSLFYSAADACVIPSYYESFCMVALESLACGTPIVATNVGGIRDITRSNEMGYIVDQNSPDHLAGAICKLLLSEKEKRTKEVDIRRSAMAEFSWINITDIILNEYRRLLIDCPSGTCL